MDSGIRYGELISEIIGIEGEVAKSEKQIQTIDIGKILASKAENGKPRAYSEAAVMVSRMEGAEIEAERRARAARGIGIIREAGSETAKTAMDMERTARPQPAESQQEKRTISISPMTKMLTDIESKAVSEERELYKETVDIEKSVGEEIERALGRIKTARAAKGKPATAENPEEVEANGDAVLPTLPIADQVQELEKIAEGIDSNSFNSNEMGIIRFEVESLRKSTTSENPVEESGLERSMRMLRNSRRDYVLALLKSS